MMNLKNFQLLKEDADSYHVGHPNGKKMVVSKKGMSEKAHAMIKKMCMGGSVQKYADGTPDAVVQEAPPAVMPAQNPDNQSQVTTTPTTTADFSGPPEPEAVPAVNPVSVQTAAPAAVSSMVANLDRPLQEQKAANKEMASQVNLQSIREQEALMDTRDAVAALPTSTELVNAAKAKDKALYDAYANKTIDPDHYWHNKSVPSKIAAGLGMILSGAGGGAAKQAPMAQEMIKNAIDRDMDAQKNAQGQQMNLWKMNREALGTDLAADLQTKNQMYTGLKYKLDAAAAQFKGPIAAANAQMANALIDQHIAENHFKLQMLQPTSDNPDPSSHIGALERFGLITKEQAQKSLEEVKNSQDIKALAPKIMDAFDRASSRNPNTSAQGKREFEGLINTTVKEQEGTARQAAFDSIHNTMTPSGTFAGPGENAAKKRTVQEYLSSKAAAPYSKSIGVDLDRFPTTNVKSILQPAQKGPEVRYDAQGQGWTKDANGKIVKVK